MKVKKKIAPNSLYERAIIVHDAQEPLESHKKLGYGSQPYLEQLRYLMICLQVQLGTNFLLAPICFALHCLCAHLQACVWKQAVVHKDGRAGESHKIALTYVVVKAVFKVVWTGGLTLLF